MSNLLKRTFELNIDVSNEKPNNDQDCSDVVNISVYFDGTGNNKDMDKNKKKWSNSARLWKCQEQYILNVEKKCNIPADHAIYVSGVGTYFNAELSSFQRVISWMQDYLGLGKGLGLGGKRRLDYGEDQLNDSLRQVLTFNAKKAEIELDKYIAEKKILQLC